MRIFVTDEHGTPYLLTRGAPSLAWRSRSSARPARRPSWTNHYRPSHAAQSRHIHKSYSPLFTYVTNANWDQVLRRVQTHPQELQYMDERSGDLPLHAACRRRPPVEIVQALLLPPNNNVNNSNNGSNHLLPYNRDGWTPLHVAVSHACSRDVLACLLEACPASVAQTTLRTTRTPMHCAASSFRELERHAFFDLLQASLEYTDNRSSTSHKDNRQHVHKAQEPPRVIGEQVPIEKELSSSDNMVDPFAWNSLGDDAEDHVLENVNSSGTTNLLCLQDVTGATPLGLLFRRYKERVRQVCSRINKLELSHDEALRLVSVELGPLWEKARGMVERISSAILFAQQDDVVLDNVESEDVVPFPSSEERGEHQSEAWHEQESESLHEPFLVRSERAFEEITTPQTREKCFRLVHASVGLIGFGCPPEMIRLAVSLYPHQVKVRDEDGYLPLHICAQKFCEHAKRVANHTPDFLIDGEDASFQLQQEDVVGWDDALSILSEGVGSVFTATSTVAGFSARKSPWDQVFDILLQQYPQGASMLSQPTKHQPTRSAALSAQGSKLPLELAMKDSMWIQAKMSWRRDGLERLLYAHPPALHLVMEKLLRHASRDDVGIMKHAANSGLDYARLFHLLLARDYSKDSGYEKGPLLSRFGNRPRSRQMTRTIRWNAQSSRRTPLDVARKSAVYLILRTKPELMSS